MSAQCNGSHGALASCSTPCSCLGLHLGWKEEVAAQCNGKVMMLWKNGCLHVLDYQLLGADLGNCPKFLGRRRMCHRQVSPPAFPAALCRHRPSAAVIAQAVFKQELLYSEPLEEQEIG